LPALQEVEFLSDEKYLTHLPVLARICDQICIPRGAYTGPQISFEFRALFLALNDHGHRLTRLSVQEVDWSIFNNSEPQTWIYDAMKSLRHLSFCVPGRDRGFLEAARLKVAEFISAPKQLQTLQFSCRTDALTELVKTGRSWLRLQDLSISRINFGRDDALEFLIAHAHTLKRLELVIVSLSVYYISADLEWIFPSWTTFLKSMQKCVKLEQFKIAGRICHDDGDEAEGWYVNKLAYNKSGGIHTECLRGRIENYIVNGGDWIPECGDLAKGDYCWQCAR
jgi:hypothetical protein